LLFHPAFLAGIAQSLEYDQGCDAMGIFGAKLISTLVVIEACLSGHKLPELCSLPHLYLMSEVGMCASFSCPLLLQSTVLKHGESFVVYCIEICASHI
jgi:hypothetical protein